MSTLLQMNGITKTYGRVIANDAVDLSLARGEILCVVGENGAGKSTLMKVLYGLEQPDSGQIVLNGQEVRLRTPSDAMRLGIGMVQQHFMLFGPMTVAENIVFGAEAGRFGLYDRAANRQQVQALSRQYGLAVDPDLKVEDCPVGIQQRVEILKTLHQNADIIIFDEPTAVLTPQETGELLASMRLLAQMGKSLILITHKLGEVMEVADRVLVMRDGRKVAQRAIEETSVEELSSLMIGRRMARQELAPQLPLDHVLEAIGLSLGHEQGHQVLHDVSLHVRAGEIVGIAGVSGNGQTELIHCLTGIETKYSGSVRICGQDVSHLGVRAARDAGLSFIPEDRYVWGSAAEASLEENSLMGYEASPPLARHGILRNKAITARALALIKQYSVVADSVRQRMRELSGGNAQKLIAARELERGLPLLIACEPTRGIDIGAMEFIHQQLIDKRSAGVGILLVSSELDEILKLSDRIYVMYGGRLVHMFTRGSVDSDILGVMMLGGQLENAKT